MEACSAPKVDKYIVDFLGKNYPREQDSGAIKTQAAVLAITRPLASAWQSLWDAGLEEDPELVVPAGSSNGPCVWWAMLQSTSHKQGGRGSL